MIISLTKKFIFVHNPKAAGSSIQHALAPFDDGYHLKLETKHESMKELLNRQDYNFSDFNCFGFVRNPWDRFCSFYHFLRKHSERYPEIKNITDVNDLANNIDKEWLQNKYSIKLQSDYFDDSVFIGRYENLHADFQSILSNIDVKASLPHENKSSIHSYRELYNAKGREIIESYYQTDIINFNYSF